MELPDSGCQRQPTPDVLVGMAQAVRSSAGDGNRPHEHRERESANAWRGVKRPADQRAADAQRWTEAREAGVSVGEVARRAGVSPATVSRATSAAVQAGRGPTPAEVQGWVLQRRGGASVAEIARQSRWSAHTIDRH